ncbi:MAG: hypothetical protein ACR2PQ_13010, partial [Myxococcota bacterium]
MADEYQCLQIEKSDGIATITIAHPPIKLFDVALMQEMGRAGREVESDDEVRVVVVESDDPDFFIAHADVELILQLPVPEPGAPPATAANPFHAIVDR